MRAEATDVQSYDPSRVRLSSSALLGTNGAPDDMRHGQAETLRNVATTGAACQEDWKDGGEGNVVWTEWRREESISPRVAKACLRLCCGEFASDDCPRSHA